METILIKISRPKKVNYLIQILRSLDFVASVDRLGKYVKAKKFLDEINEEAAKRGLSEISEEEIQKVIKSYRSGK